MKTSQSLTFLCLALVTGQAAEGASPIPQQTATASGDCSAAGNAYGNATLSLTVNCIRRDPRVDALEAKHADLKEKVEESGKVIAQSTRAVEKTSLDAAVTLARLGSLVAAITEANAIANRGSSAESKIVRNIASSPEAVATLLKARGNSELLNPKSTKAKAASFYLKSARLLESVDLQKALATYRMAERLSPNDFDVLNGKISVLREIESPRAPCAEIRRLLAVAEAEISRQEGSLALWRSSLAWRYNASCEERMPALEKSLSRLREAISLQMLRPQEGVPNVWDLQDDLAYLTDEILLWYHSENDFSAEVPIFEIKIETLKNRSIWGPDSDKRMVNLYDLLNRLAMIHGHLLSDHKSAASVQAQAISISRALYESSPDEQTAAERYFHALTEQTTYTDKEDAREIADRIIADARRYVASNSSAEARSAIRYALISAQRIASNDVARSREAFGLMMELYRTPGLPAFMKRDLAETYGSAAIWEVAHDTQLAHGHWMKALMVSEEISREPSTRRDGLWQFAHTALYCLENDQLLAPVDAKNLQLKALESIDAYNAMSSSKDELGIDHRDWGLRFRLVDVKVP